MSDYSPSPLWLRIQAKLEQKASDSTGYDAKLKELSDTVTKAKPGSPEQHDAQVALAAFMAQTTEPYSSINPYPERRTEGNCDSCLAVGVRVNPQGDKNLCDSCWLAIDD
jgi:hypothetical protein